MVRKLKILIVAVLGLMAFGAMGVQGSQAAEFHCSIALCDVGVKADGTGKQSHHVIVIKQGGTSAALTCGSMSGESSLSTKTSAELTIDGLAYKSCTLAGVEASVKISSCDYRTVFGAFEIHCLPGSPMTITAGSCEIKFLTQLSSGLSFTNINSKQEITVSFAVKKLNATASECAGLGLANGEYKESEYTTGNTILFGESFGATVWYE